MSDEKILSFDDIFKELYGNGAPKNGEGERKINVDVFERKSRPCYVAVVRDKYKDKTKSIWRACGFKTKEEADKMAKKLKEEDTPNEQ